MGSSKRKASLLVAAVVAWLLMTGVVAPKLVRDGYEGRSIAPVNRYFEHRRSKPPEYYLDRLRTLAWSSAALGGVIVAAGFFVAREEKNGYSWSRRAIREASPEALGMIRFITCMILAGYTVYDEMPSIALLPRDLIGEGGFGVVSMARYLPGFRAIESSGSALLAIQAATVAALAMGAVGFKTRWSLPVGLVGYTFCSGLLRTPIYVFHTGLAPIYVLAILCITPSGDGFSVDRMLRGRRPGSLPWSGTSLAYGWARFGCWTMIAIVYFSAGLSKLINGGLFWWEPRTMRSRILACALDPMTLDFDLAIRLKDTPDTLIAALGIGTLVIELGMILTPFSRLARLTLPIGCLMMHVGIMFLQNLFFFDLMVIQAIFLVPDRPRWPFGPRPEVAPEPGSEARPVRPEMVVGILAMTIASFLCAVNKVEFFPITAWGMFSAPPTPEKTTIQYHKLLVHYTDGTTARAHPDRQVHAFKETRYRSLFWPTWQSADGARKLDEFLRTCAAIDNASRPTGPRVDGYDLQQWEWDWEKDADNPAHGHMVKEHRVTIAP